MKRKEIFELAKRLAIEYQSDPKKLARELGIIVKYRSFNTYSGCCIRMNGKQLIVVNSNMSKMKKLFVLAHEIAHLLLHPYDTIIIRSFSISENKIEFEANYFAKIFLSESELEFEEDKEIMQLLRNIDIFQ